MIQVCPAAVGELKRGEVKVNYLVIDIGDPLANLVF